jgi:UV DNA damage endonuclease
MIYKNNMGYCCICLSLDKEGVTTNRGMVKKTFLREGLKYVSELALKNTSDLIRIIKFNAENSIKMYRISSDMFPWMSEYEITGLPDWKLISANLKLAGKLATEYKQRLEFHPGPFNVLASLSFSNRPISVLSFSI